MIKLTNKNFNLIKSGKRQTIRLGIKCFSVGNSKIVNIDTNEEIECLITKVELTQFQWLSCDDAKREGFDSLPDLKNELVRIYGKISDNDIITVVNFEIKDSGASQ